MSIKFPAQFKLTTRFVESRNLFLEGNGGVNPKNELGGAAFMSAQENASGTIWKALPGPNGTFQLTNLFLEKKGLVLEGNGGVNSKNELGGAALMSPQKNASGTMWKAIPVEDGFFELTTLFVEDRGLALEGNGGVNPKNELGGAAFMSPQKGATGRMWKFVAV